MTLLHTALRVSELLSLNYPKQFKDGYLLNIQRKGKKLTRKLRVPKQAQTAIREYLQHERGKGAGPLFQSKTGKPLAVQKLDAFQAGADSFVGTHAPAHNSEEGGGEGYPLYILRVRGPGQAPVEPDELQP